MKCNICYQPLTYKYIPLSQKDFWFCQTQTKNPFGNTHMWIEALNGLITSEKDVNGYFFSFISNEIVHRLYGNRNKNKMELFTNPNFRQSERAWVIPQFIVPDIKNDTFLVEKLVSKLSNLMIYL